MEIKNGHSTKGEDSVILQNDHFQPILIPRWKPEWAQNGARMATLSNPIITLSTHFGYAATVWLALKHGPHSATTAWYGARKAPSGHACFRWGLIVVVQAPVPTLPQVHFLLLKCICIFIHKPLNLLSNNYNQTASHCSQHWALVYIVLFHQPMAQCNCPKFEDPIFVNILWSFSWQVP